MFQIHDAPSPTTTRRRVPVEGATAGLAVDPLGERRQFDIVVPGRGARDGGGVADRAGFALGQLRPDARVAEIGWRAATSIEKLQGDATGHELPIGAFLVAARLRLEGVSGARSYAFPHCRVLWQVLSLDAMLWSR